MCIRDRANNTSSEQFLLAAGSAGIAAATNIVVSQADTYMPYLVYAAVIVLCFISVSYTHLEFEAYYNSLIASGNGALSVPLQQVHVNYDNGPTLPWLGIWFSDAQTGYIVGSFGDIAHTEDGGKTWQPWLDHIDNPNFYDLNAVAEVGGQIYIAGEQGIVYRLDAAHEKFVALSTGYGGSLFGLTGTVKTLIAFGMEGMIYHSEDRGQTWERSNNTSTAGIMDGVVLADGRIALVSENGGIPVSYTHLGW